MWSSSLILAVSIERVEMRPSSVVSAAVTYRIVQFLKKLYTGKPTP